MEFCIEHLKALSPECVFYCFSTIIYENNKKYQILKEILDYILYFF